MYYSIQWTTAEISDLVGYVTMSSTMHMINNLQKSIKSQVKGPI